MDIDILQNCKAKLQDIARWYIYIYIYIYIWFPQWKQNIIIIDITWSTNCIIPGKLNTYIYSIYFFQFTNPNCKMTIGKKPGSSKRVLGRHGSAYSREPTGSFEVWRQETGRDLSLTSAGFKQVDIREIKNRFYYSTTVYYPIKKDQNRLQSQDTLYLLKDDVEVHTQQFFARLVVPAIIPIKSQWVFVATRVIAGKPSMCSCMIPKFLDGRIIWHQLATCLRFPRPTHLMHPPYHLICFTYVSHLYVYLLKIYIQKKGVCFRDFPRPGPSIYIYIYLYLNIYIYICIHI